MTTSQSATQSFWRDSGALSKVALGVAFVQAATSFDALVLRAIPPESVVLTGPLTIGLGWWLVLSAPGQAKPAPELLYSPSRRLRPRPPMWLRVATFSMAIFALALMVIGFRGGDQGDAHLTGAVISAVFCAFSLLLSWMYFARHRTNVELGAATTTDLQVRLVARYLRWPKPVVVGLLIGMLAGFLAVVLLPGTRLAQVGGATLGVCFVAWIYRLESIQFSRTVGAAILVFAGIGTLPLVVEIPADWQDTLTMAQWFAVAIAGAAFVRSMFRAMRDVSRR